MSHINHRSIPFFGLLLSVLIFSLTACSPDQRFVLTEAAAALNEGVDTALTEPNDLVFAGQVEDENGRWLNNRVVILFRNGEEVRRDITGLKESGLTIEGPMDGVFELRITNNYKLSVAHEVYYVPSRSLVEMRTVAGMVGTQYLGNWHEDLLPADMVLMNVPSKQLEFALVVLPMPLDELPDSHRAGNLSFHNGILVIKPEAQPDEPEPATAVPLQSPQSNVQFTVLPSNGPDWHLQMTGYYGTRWEVWEQFVAGKGSGVSWETFKEAVLVYNPHLEMDGFVFYPDKSYLLPYTQ
jgi:hypothetical protein